jgi:putative ABC transport system permease protein
VNEAFAKARHLVPGNPLVLVLNGRREALTVVGTVLSAEHVVAMRPDGALPDDAHYAILWLPYDALATAFDARGTFNEAVLWLAPDARERTTLAAVDAVLLRYGGYGALGRSDHPVHRFVDDELRGLEVEAMVVPFVFLAVSAFLLHVVLARVVAAERTQIATLRALGFPVAPIARHYLALATLTATAGAIPGLLGGALLGAWLTRIYGSLFRFPHLSYRIEPMLVALGLGVSVVAAAAGALASVRSIARLAPAEAMQPPAPPRSRATFVARCRLVARLPPAFQITAGELARRPGRPIASAFGIAAAMAVLVVGAFWIDAIESLVDTQFHRIQREDTTITFTTPVHDRAVRELAHVPGIRAVEGLRAVPARVTNGTRGRQVDVLGLPAPSTLHPLMARSGDEIALVAGASSAVVLSRNLAEALEVGRGGTVSLELLERTRARLDAIVAGVADEPVGMVAYMEIRGLAKLLDEAPQFSSALVSFDAGRKDAMYDALRRLPRVATSFEKSVAVKSFEQTIGKIVEVFSSILTLFGALLVGGIVSSAARILLGERAREFATLRILGFTRRDVSELLLLELASQVVLALPVGAALGALLSSIAVRLFAPEDVSIPFVIGPRTWALSIGVVGVAALASALTVRRRLDQLDLMSALSVRE